MNYKKLINEAQNNNIADMYDTFSHILSEKVIDGIVARKMNITSNLIKEDCDCENCDCKDKKVTCSKCNGEGCEHCDDKGYHIVDESVAQHLKRQLKNPKTEVMVVDKKGNVITINKRDLKKYIAKGYGIAESVQLDKNHMVGKTVLVAGRKGKVIKFLDSEYGTEQYKVKLEDGSVITASSIEMETTDPIGLDEAKGMTFVFPDERKAKQFDLDIENSGIGIGDRIGNKVTVTGVARRWRAAIKKAMLKSKGKIVKESVELDEGTPAYRKAMAAYKNSDAKKVFDILKKRGFRVYAQSDTLVRNMLKKNKGNVQKAAAEIEKKYPGHFK